MSKKLNENDLETPPSITLFQQLDSEYSIIEQMIFEHPSEGNIISFLVFLQKVRKSELRETTREVTQKLYENLFSRMRKAQNILRNEFGKDVFEHARKQVKALFLPSEENGSEISLRAVQPKKPERSEKRPKKPKTQQDVVVQDTTKKLKTKQKLNSQLAKPGREFERRKKERGAIIAKHVEKKKRRKKPKKVGRKTK